MSKTLEIPIQEKIVRELKVGDIVKLNGVIMTGRDAAHKYISDTFIRKPCPPEESEVYDELKKTFQGGAIYHCGPVVAKLAEGGWKMVSAGPTTSIREEPYEADVIEHFGLRAIIGKGGMGKKTLDACKKFGCVYLHAVGGAATYIAQMMPEVLGVYKMEFGAPEAFWKVRVKDFETIVTMDTHGRSIHDEVYASSKNALKELTSAK